MFSHRIGRDTKSSIKNNGDNLRCNSTNRSINHRLNSPGDSSNHNMRVPNPRENNTRGNQNPRNVKENLKEGMEDREDRKTGITCPLTILLKGNPQLKRYETVEMYRKNTAFR